MLYLASAAGYSWRVIHDRQSGIAKLNSLGASRTPHFFLVDFLKSTWFVCTQPDLPAWELRFRIRGGPSHPADFANTTATPGSGLSAGGFSVLRPPAFADYLRAFRRVQAEQTSGNSYVCNLTGRTEASIPGGLASIARVADAEFVLHVADRRITSHPFAVFSPEGFLATSGDTVSTRPMKGTRRWRAAGLQSSQDALQELLADSKEEDEHRTVVDLLRNDLGIVGTRVRVPEWRYAEFIPNAEGGLWATSSLVQADLPPDWRANLGSILESVLPAGSVSGAPKLETLRIISEAEGRDRGFYTGVAGWFDGEALRSWVLIRFVEEEAPGKFVFRSGGGITTRSSAAAEYLELVAKAALPLSASPTEAVETAFQRAESRLSEGMRRRLTAARDLPPATPLFVETIGLRGGWTPLFEEHSIRFSRTMTAWRHYLAERGEAASADFGEVPDLARLVLKALERDEVALVHTGMLRCRVLYAAKVQSIEFTPYERAPYKSAVLIPGDGIEYSAKLVDRSQLAAAASAAALAPDEYPLFCRGNLVTDGLGGNIIVNKDGRLLTPREGLLRGTMRAWLIGKGLVEPADLTVEDLLEAGEVQIINAFNGPGEFVLPVAASRIALQK